MPRQDSKAARIVGCIAAEAESLFEMSRSADECAVLGLLLSTSAKPSCETKCAQNVNALLIAKRNGPALRVSLNIFNFARPL